MEPLEEYASTEQITAVISSQNDDSQPDQSPFDESIDSEPSSVVKNETTPLISANTKLPEIMKLSLDGKTTRVTSSQNVVSTATNSVTTNSVNYTLPELSDESSKVKVKVDEISAGISDLKLSPTQVSYRSFVRNKSILCTRNSSSNIYFLELNSYKHQHPYQYQCHLYLMV